MKHPQYVFRPNLDDPQQRQAWTILTQIPSGQRKAFLVQAILATEQDDRLEKSSARSCKRNSDSLILQRLFSMSRLLNLSRLPQ